MERWRVSLSATSEGAYGNPSELKTLGLKLYLWPQESTVCIRLVSNLTAQVVRCIVRVTQDGFSSSQNTNIIMILN
jgi:hypothetical protein